MNVEEESESEEGSVYLTPRRKRGNKKSKKRGGKGKKDRLRVVKLGAFSRI